MRSAKKNMLHQKLTKKRGGNTKTLRSFNRCHPSKLKNNDNSFSCFNKPSLLKIIKQWNSQYSSKINFDKQQSATELWNLIDSKLNQQCNSESCWITLPFIKESKDEMDHSYKFTDYLIARGQSVNLHELPSPIQKWDSIEDIISFAFNMEAELTISLQQLYSIAERSSDIRTNVFLDPIIESQIVSENEFAHILSKVKFASGSRSALLMIDEYLYKK